MYSVRRRVRQQEGRYELQEMRSGYICQWCPYRLPGMLGRILPAQGGSDGMRQVSKGILAGKAEKDILRHLPRKSPIQSLPWLPALRHPR